MIMVLIGDLFGTKSERNVRWVQVLEIVDDKVRIMTVTEEFLPGEFSEEESSWKGKLEVQKS